MSEMYTGKTISPPVTPNAWHRSPAVRIATGLFGATLALVACSSETDKEIGANSAAHIAADSAKASASRASESAAASMSSAEASISSAAAANSSSAASLSSAEASRSAASSSSAAATTTVPSPSRTTTTPTPSGSSSTSSSHAAPAAAPAPANNSNLVFPNLPGNGSFQCDTGRGEVSTAVLEGRAGPYCDEQTVATANGNQQVEYVCSVGGEGVQGNNVWDEWRFPNTQELHISSSLLLQIAQRRQCTTGENFTGAAPAQL